MKYISILSLVIFLLWSCPSYTQELNCNVQVNAQKLQSSNPSDKKYFDNLQKALYQFVNGRKWTVLDIRTQERIECGMVVNVTERDINTNAIKASLSIQARRPVYNSSYSTSIFNMQDNDFSFTFSEYDNLEFYDNNVSSNLTAVVSYYCYLIMALYFDSFALEGGQVFYDRAQNIVNLAQSLPEAGWKPIDRNNMNRYWIIEGYTNANYRIIHEIIYRYHRFGMDVMYQDADKARIDIVEALKNIQQLNALKSALPCKQLFMESKAEELISIFAPVSREEKQMVMDVLKKVDPSNMSKYQRISNTNGGDQRSPNTPTRR